MNLNLDQTGGTERRTPTRATISFRSNNPLRWKGCRCQPIHLCWNTFAARVQHICQVQITNPRKRGRNEKFIWQRIKGGGWSGTVGTTSTKRGLDIWVWCGLACCSSTIRTILCFEFALPAEDYRLAGAAVGLTHHKWWVIASPQHGGQRFFQYNEGGKNVQPGPILKKIKN